MVLLIQKFFSTGFKVKQRKSKKTPCEYIAWAFWFPSLHHPEYGRGFHFGRLHVVQFCNGVNQGADRTTPDTEMVGDCVVCIAAFFATQEVAVVRLAVGCCGPDYVPFHQAGSCGDGDCFGGGFLGGGALLLSLVAFANFFCSLLSAIAFHG